MSSSSSDSDFSAASDNSGKMEALLQEWDAKEEGGAATFESDDDNDDSDEDGAKLAKLKASAASAEDSEESSSAASEEESAASSDNESASEASEVASVESEDEESEYEEEVVGDDEYVDDEHAVIPAKSSPKPKSKSDDGDDDDSEVIDDGDITDKLKKKPKKKKEKIKAKKITDDIDENDPEAAEMKKLLGDWGVDGDDEDEDDDDDDEEESEASEREVILADGVIDHIVLAAPDLDEAISNFEKLTGIAPKVAGTINGLGIKCARISFNDSSYLEIIAPDPKGPGPIGNLIKSKGIKELTPFHYAIRSSKAEDLKSEVKRFNYVPDHITMFGGNKDGVPKKWEMLFLYGHRLGGVCPFIINWGSCDHPCATLPVVGKLKKFSIRAPEEDPVHQLLDHLNVSGINIEKGENKMSFQLSTPEGTVKFATKKAVGFKFPGFEDDNPDAADMDVMGDENEDIEFEAPVAPELIETGDFDEYEDLPPPAY